MHVANFNSSAKFSNTTTLWSAQLNWSGQAGRGLPRGVPLFVRVGTADSLLEMPAHRPAVECHGSAVNGR